MKKLILHIFLIIFLFNVMLCNSQKNKIRKNILAVVFPGGQYKNIYMKKLFDYSLNYNNDYDYYYDIVIHYSEKRLWEDSLNNDKYRNRYFLYTYGAISDEIEKYDIDDYHSFIFAYIHNFIIVVALLHRFFFPIYYNIILVLAKIMQNTSPAIEITGRTSLG